MYNFAVADPSSIGGTAIGVCDESSAEMAMTGLAGTA